MQPSKRMNKKITTTLSLVTVLTGISHAATFSPIAATGWNYDVVIGAGEDTSGRTGTMDDGPGGGRATWYGIGYNTDEPTTGLPTGLTTSQTLVDGVDTVEFQLQDFTQNNAILDSGTLSFNGSFSRLALFGSTGDGPADMNITVNYEDGTNQFFSNLGGSGINHDWYGDGDVAYIARGRIEVDLAQIQPSVDNPRLFQTILDLNSTANVTSVVIASLGSGHNAVMAVSGVAVPEPSTLLLGFLGLTSLLIRRR